MSTVTKHGSFYFYTTKDIECPECHYQTSISKDAYSVKQIITDTDNPANGVYEMICSYCGCEWQISVKEDTP